MAPDKLAKAIALSHWRTALYFGATAWLLLALGFLIRIGAGSGIGRLSERWSTRPWFWGLIAAPIWLTILSLLELPAALIGHHVSLQFGLSIESWPDWWVDWAKSTVLFVGFGTLVVEALFALMRFSPRRWWLWFWIFTLPVEVFLVFLAPVVIDPLFNHFQPLAKTDAALVDQLERVAARGRLDIPPNRIFLMDASRKVTGPNAYVTGLGASKRIVVWDTTLRLESPDEVLFTYGHEQGHYVLHHVAKGIAFSAPLFLFFFWIGSWALDRLTRNCRGAGSVGNWDSLGLVLLLAIVLNFLADPVANAFSRRIEHQADVYGQEVIHGLVPDPQSTAEGSFCRDAQFWLDNPAPNRFVEFWTYSHPSTEQRAEFAAGYDPWLPGRHPRYFRQRQGQP
jgi:STE24 endopeptidase